MHAKALTFLYTSLTDPIFFFCGSNVQINQPGSHGGLAGPERTDGELNATVCRPVCESISLNGHTGVEAWLVCVCVCVRVCVYVCVW